MKRSSHFYLVLPCLVISLLNLSCKKESEIPPTTATVCNVKGTFSGTSTRSTGVVSAMTYQLQDNNFAVGTITPTGNAVTFGGYRNTCDSVFISSYFTSNSNYYLLKGKLLNSGTTITGTYNNLTTTSDFGTFSISK
jgi:hypothetical protein